MQCYDACPTCLVLYPCYNRKIVSFFCTIKFSLWVDLLLLWKFKSQNWEKNSMLVDNLVSFSLISNLSKDRQFWLNIWKLGILWHASYISERVLINWLYLRCKQLKFCIPYFMHRVHDNSSQAFIKPIWFIA